MNKRDLVSLVMKVPAIRGIIDRRILVNYRVEPDVLAAVLPSPFEPVTVNAYGIAGICLIRLKDIRPSWLPIGAGLRSENAAHRIAVRWMEDGVWKEGVYIPRRDTDSRLNTLVGGRIFPGVHHYARFEVEESTEDFSVNLTSSDKKTTMQVSAKLTTEMPTGSIFNSIDAVSEFFEAGALGYSPGHGVGEYEALELRSFNWQVEPLDVNDVSSSFFQDQDLFPSGSVAFDNALLMRNIKHEWHQHEPLCN